MAFTENPSVFTDPAGFGSSAVWSVGNAVVDGIFDDDYADPLGLADAHGPVFALPATSAPTLAKGQTLTIAAKVYTVQRVKKPMPGRPDWWLAILSGP